MTLNRLLNQDRCSYRPGEVERQTQPAALLDAEGVGAENRCGDPAKQIVPGGDRSLEVLQPNPEKSPAARPAATESVCQQTFSILKVMELYLEHTWSQNLKDTEFSEHGTQSRNIWGFLE